MDEIAEEWKNGARKERGKDETGKGENEDVDKVSGVAGGY